jgi:hypothetical protein
MAIGTLYVNPPINTPKFLRINSINYITIIELIPQDWDSTKRKENRIQSNKLLSELADALYRRQLVRVLILLLSELYKL